MDEPIHTNGMRKRVYLCTRAMSGIPEILVLMDRQTDRQAYFSQMRTGMILDLDSDFYSWRYMRFVCVCLCVIYSYVYKLRHSTCTLCRIHYMHARTSHNARALEGSR